MRMQCTVLTAIVLSAGCKVGEQGKSEAAKRQQDSAVTLRYEHDRACTIAGMQLSPDSAVKMRGECDVATRNLNRFLSGK